MSKEPLQKEIENRGDKCKNYCLLLMVIIVAIGIILEFMGLL